MVTKPKATAGASTFEWRQNLARISCFKILEQLHQINPSVVKFSDAASLPVSDLNYWPTSSNSPELLQMSAMLLTQQYVRILSRSYVLTAERDATWKVVQRAMEQVLTDSSKTLDDLAQAIDELIKFEDE